MNSSGLGPALGLDEQVAEDGQVAQGVGTAVRFLPTPETMRTYVPD